jgi:hypothetical protein
MFEARRVLVISLQGSVTLAASDGWPVPECFAL